MAQIGLIQLSANDDVLVRRAPMENIAFDVRLDDIPSGQVTLRAEAFDLNEVSIGTITREVTVDGDAPIVRFLEPADGSVLVGNNLFDVGLRVTNETEQVVMTLTTEAGEQLGELTQNGGQAFTFSIDPTAVGQVPMS